MLVEGCVLVEAKAVEKILPIHKAQLLSYMKLLDVPIGLLINFHELKLTDGVHRLILPGREPMNIKNFAGGNGDKERSLSFSLLAPVRNSSHLRL